MINEVRIARLKGRLRDEYLESAGGDSPDARTGLVAEALEWARKSGTEVPKGWRRKGHEEYAARWNVNTILDGTGGVQRQFLDFWNAFLDERAGGSAPVGVASDPAVGSQLSDADVERIAAAVVRHLTRALGEYRP